MPIVSRDPETGRVMVMDSASDTFAIRENGSWRPGVIRPDDLKDNFERVEDPTEALMLLNEAKAALDE